MADRFYLILEILAVLLCLHGLYGEKFKWNSYTILFVVIDYIVYQSESACGEIRYCQIIIYFLFILYCKLQFKYSWKINIMNSALCIMITALIQLICYLPVTFLYYVIPIQLIGYIINISLIIILLALNKYKTLNKISLYMQQKGKIVGIFLGLTITIIVFAIYNLRIYKRVNAIDYFILALGIIVLFSILLLLQKEKLYNKQMETERNLNKLYGDALTELIEKVRMNQHNYKNQLVALQGMVYTAHNLEDLKEEQERYFNHLLREDKYSIIISGNNDPVIAGFLYSKLCNNNFKDIVINCHIRINKITDSLFVSDIIKILGVLIDNAIEEIEKEKYEDKCIDVKIFKDAGFNIEVGNICDYISIERINEFFKKGYSSKGKNRGLGLYSVKNIVKKWSGEISVDNSTTKNEKNWFYVKIYIPNK